MAEIFAFVSPKGGCGSTFVCAGLWRTLADMDSKVLALDFSFDRCTLDFALGFQSDYVYTLSDVLSGGCDLSEAVVCDAGTSGAGFLRGDYEYDGMDFSKVSSLIKSAGYDYVLIDLQMTDYSVIQGVLSFAHKLVYVTEPTAAAVKLCEDSAGRLDFEHSFILVNKIIPSYTQSGIHLTVDEIMDITGCALLGLVPWTPEAEIILKQGLTKGICDLSLKTVFANIALRIKGEHTPAYDIKKVYDCFKLGRKFALKGD